MKLTIDELRVIEQEYLDNFEFKAELNEVEIYGLELILMHLLNDFNDEIGIESNSFEVIDKYTIHREDRLDILDGCYDILVLGGHSVSSVLLTTNGIPVLMCYGTDEDDNILDDSEYYVTVG